MTKYSAEFKLKVVKEYFRGELGTTLLARKYREIPEAKKRGKKV